MASMYDERYNQKDYYWGLKPSSTCSSVIDIIPPSRPLKLLDAGCGEGRDAVYFATRGYSVTGFDTSPFGIEKARRLADKSKVEVEFFIADINEFRLAETFDIIFSTGVLQYIPEKLRQEILGNYKQFTSIGGINALSVFVTKPFIGEAPDSEQSAHSWISGELLTLYREWKIEYTAEDIFDCMSSGEPHQHAMSRVIARKVQSSPEH